MANQRALGQMSKSRKSVKMLLSICQAHPELRKLMFKLPESVTVNSKEQNADTVREKFENICKQGLRPDNQHRE